MLVAETSDMATAVQNITLSAPRNIPLSKLVLSQAIVRCLKAGVSIEKLGRGHLAAHVSAGPQRTAGTGTREPGDRYVRRPGSASSRPCGETGAIQIGSISRSCFWAAIVHG